MPLHGTSLTIIVSLTQSNINRHNNTHITITIQVQGGISNGENIVVRVAFKPTSTIGREQNTVTRAGEETTIRGKGRHDPCVLPRAVRMLFFCLPSFSCL